ncbi:hypothetical protein ACFQ34_17675 [Pseudonocardia benzenivorans]|uniref:Uncharacterized protein n=1 Tax=Pseudonocardia benzenivorans TaxID=228005 RepID=A0ABW3VKF7_9PSEU
MRFAAIVLDFIRTSPPTHTDGESLRRHLRRPADGTIGDADLSSA